jgi:tetratricopeptide (TPR) repeat protein
MKNILARGVAFLLVFVFVASPVWATCGGGGGGGGGGMSGSSSGGGSNPVVYHVPWKIPDPKATPVTEGLILYWFPASAEEVKKSSLLESRDLSLYAGQCVTMKMDDMRDPDAKKLIGESTLPVAVLASPDNTLISKIENTAGKLKVGDVEKLVGGEIKTRETKLDGTLKDAKAKASAGDNANAITLYKTVAAEKCMFPKKAKEAQSALKKLGAENIGEIAQTPNLDPAVTAMIVGLMKKGLVAENAGRYTLAEQYYQRASTLDPADPTPLRYLGELHRHDTGNWIKARTEFGKILAMPSDPLSRAVALHGLGKITIHDGEFKKGLHMIEDSVATYPLPLAYRNLAVYWNSEGDLVQGNYFTEKALALDPTDPYNVVFAAVFMAASGRKDEALKVAMSHIDLLPASYNLAAIFAQAGQREKALEMLKRHFYTYERYDQVRSKEMMEARVDAVFDSLRDDKDFVALTKDADGRLPIPQTRGMAEPMENKK